MFGLSLVEKLAITGAFLALVALAVGTENDPGIVVTGTEGLARAEKPSASDMTTASEAPSNPDSEIAPEAPPAVVMQTPVSPATRSVLPTPRETQSAPGELPPGTLIIDGRPMT